MTTTSSPPSAGPHRAPRILLVLATAAALVIVLAGARSAAGIIGPAALALVLVVTVQPIRVWLETHHLPRWAASLITSLSVYLLLVSLALALTVAVAQTASLVSRYGAELNAMVNDVTRGLDSLGVGDEQVDRIVSALDVGKLVSFASALIAEALGVVSNLVFILTLVLFMAFDTPGTTSGLSGAEKHRPDLVNGLRSFAVGARTYMGVSAMFGGVVAIIDAVALVLLGVPGAFVWGVLAFVSGFIPNVGFVIGVIPPALIALLEGGPVLMVWVLVLYCAVNVVVQSIIQPRIVGDAVGLASTLTMLSLVFWAWLLGALGAILAVPLTLLVRALLVEADPEARWVLPLLSGKPDDPVVNDPRRGVDEPSEHAGDEEKAAEASQPRGQGQHQTE